MEQESTGKRAYAELQVTSNFSFLRGASHPDELIDRALELGYQSIALTDRNSLAGVVRAHVAAKFKPIQFIPGCRLDLKDGPSLLAYPTDKQAYARLSALLSKGNMRTEKGDCLLYREDVYQATSGIQLVLLPPLQLDRRMDFDESFTRFFREYKEAFKDRLFIAASRSYQSEDLKRLYRIAQYSKETGIPMVATNDVHYHKEYRRELQDVLTCVREKCTIHTAGYRLYPNQERHLKPVEEMYRLFAQYEEAIDHGLQLAKDCNFSLDMLRYSYPEEVVTPGKTAQEDLERLTWEGARERGEGTIKPEVRKILEQELKFIREMNYASYFLTIYDIVRFARSRGILCQGRGSAANSAVCYCLQITSIDPVELKLLFARFISTARNEPPDIDVDFEHERREEVMQYIYEKYGRNRAAIVATVTQVREKGAVRDVAKAMGLSMDAVNQLSSSMWELDEDWATGKRISQYGFNPKDPHLKKVLELTAQYIRFPRQLGQHTGGFIITQGELTDLCPVLNARMENRTCIEWNKDDIEALGFMKVDVLALGMLSCMKKAFDLAKDFYGLEWTIDTLANSKDHKDDTKVYEMISQADTIGVFQIESRAQQSMLPRLKPTKFYDLVIEVAIVRPGPIQGDMVHPYLRRRNKEEEVEYPSAALKEILEKTEGVPLFQEQAMKIAMVAGGFTAEEADELRRSMATFKAKGMVSGFREKLIRGMTKNGYEPDFAKRIFKQLEGFGSYGFPESHAASFAVLVYVSSWIKCYYPDVFACAILNSLPMGFYQPAQLVIDAQNHGVEVRPVDVNYSSWNHSLEKSDGKYHALRLGFRQVKGLSEEEIKLLVRQRESAYSSFVEILRLGLSDKTLERLSDADTFRSIGLDRREALWQLSNRKNYTSGMFRQAPVHGLDEGQSDLPILSSGEQVRQDYSFLSLSLKAHPVSFVRNQLDALSITPAGQLRRISDGGFIKVAGLVLVRQRPGTASGICFITLEDESGCYNLVVFKKIFDAYRKDIMRAKLLMAVGRLQREGEVIHVVVSQLFNITSILMQGLEPNAKSEKSGNQLRIFPEARNFK